MVYLFFCGFSHSVKCLEEMKTQWDQFGSAYETFSIWISDKEKQLEALKSSALPLEQQISTVKVQCCVFTACPRTAIHFSAF